MIKLMTKDDIINNSITLIPETDDEKYDNMMKVCAKSYLVSKGNNYLYPFKDLKCKKITIW